jgi:hypothetical protein
MLIFLAKGYRLAAWHGSNSGRGGRNGEAGGPRAGFGKDVFEHALERPDSHCPARPIRPQLKFLSRMTVLRPGHGNVIAA